MASKQSQSFGGSNVGMTCSPKTISQFQLRLLTLTEQLPWKRFIGTLYVYIKARDGSTQ